MRHSIILCLVAALAVAGCESGGKKKLTQKELATKQWAQTRAGVLTGLARDQYQTGNFDKCRETLTAALRLDPTNPNLHILNAKLCIEQGDLEPAVHSLEEARKLDPKNAEADYLSGVVYQRWQRTQEAHDFYASALEKAPAEIAYLLARAEMLVQLDKTPEAIALMQAKVVYFEHSPAIRDAIGQLLIQTGKNAEGVEYLRQAAVLASEDLEIREHLAMGYFYNKQYREASDLFARLLKDNGLRQRAELYIAMGECQSQLGQTSQARASLETASQLNPSAPGVWVGLAKVAIQLGDIRRAELSLNKALSLDGKLADAHLMMGYVRLKQDRMSDALTSFRKASALDGEDPVSLCMIGYVMEKAGKGDQAIEFYGRALKIKPNDELATKLMAGADPRE